MLLDLSNQIDAPLVAAALKRCGQKHIHQALRHLGANHAATQGQHIGVVVPPGQLGRQRLRAKGTADALDLIGGDGDADYWQRPSATAWAAFWP